MRPWTLLISRTCPPGGEPGELNQRFKKRTTICDEIAAPNKSVSARRNHWVPATQHKVRKVKPGIVAVLKNMFDGFWYVLLYLQTYSESRIYSLSMDEYQNRLRVQAKPIESGDPKTETLGW
jgi:hypothetical protein|tara:strand:+ start:662 stop:1027 length:366 start_codon:yes stop_codon:yes gene_type:complete